MTINWQFLENVKFNSGWQFRDESGHKFCVFGAYIQSTGVEVPKDFPGVSKVGVIEGAKFSEAYESIPDNLGDGLRKLESNLFSRVAAAEVRKELIELVKKHHPEELEQHGTNN